jgi:hypothetical protein
MKQRSFAAIFSAFSIFFAVSLYNGRADARHLFSPDEAEAKIKIIIDTSSIKHIYLD